MLSFKTILFDETDEEKNTFVNIKCVRFGVFMFWKCIDAIFTFMPWLYLILSRSLVNVDRNQTTNKDNPSIVQRYTPKNMQTKHKLKNDREIIQICVFFRYFYRFPTFRHTKSHFIECLRFNWFHAMHLKVLETSEQVSLCERARIYNVKY